MVIRASWAGIALSGIVKPDEASASARRAHTLRFSRDDVELFAEASHDRNPLHFSSEFARKSPHGEPIVFGILSALACLGRLRDRPRQCLATISLEFKSPLRADTDYVVETDDLAPDRATAFVRDGGMVALKATASFRDGGLRMEAEDRPAPSPHQLEASDPDDDEFVPGLADVGRYAPAWGRLRALAHRLGLPEKGIATSQIAALLWSSYFVGMKLPGRRALFWRVTMQFESVGDGGSGEFAYEASLQSFDQRFGLAKLEARLFHGDAAFAKGELWSFVRPDVSVARSGAVAAGMQPSAVFQGKVALVIGASRGLGAAITQAMALQGCTVLANFLKSKAEAELLRESVADAPGNVVLVQGDGSDLTWCEKASLQIVGDYGALDYLVCSACPAPPSLRLHPHAARRIKEYVAQSFGLVSTPMATFLPVLRQTGGWSVTISSMSVKSPPPEWPHYVSAKYAVEGLTAAAAVEHKAVSFLIVRPPTLLTDMTNTPLHRHGAIAPERAAIRIAERLAGPPAAGRVEILEDFAQG